MVKHDKTIWYQVYKKMMHLKTIYKYYNAEEIICRVSCIKNELMGR